MASLGPPEWYWLNFHHIHHIQQRQRTRFIFSIQTSLLVPLLPETFGLVTQWEVNYFHSVLPRCTLSVPSSSPHPPPSSLGSTENKTLGVDRAEKWGGGKPKREWRQTLFPLWCIYTSFSTNKCLLRCFMVLSPGGVLNPPPDAWFSLYPPPPPSRHPSVPRVSSPIILSLELPWDVAENITTKETEEMIRVGKQGHLEFISPSVQEGGDGGRGVRMKARMRSEEKKRKSCTGEDRRGWLVLQKKS